MMNGIVIGIANVWTVRSDGWLCVEHYKYTRCAVMGFVMDSRSTSDCTQKGWICWGEHACMTLCAVMDGFVMKHNTYTRKCAVMFGR
jgi:hypothetical protein